MSNSQEQSLEERFYDRLDAEDVAGIRNFSIRCPSCDHATEFDPPEWDCEHCSETMALFVGSLANVEAEP